MLKSAGTCQLPLIIVCIPRADEAKKCTVNESSLPRGGLRRSLCCVNLFLSAWGTSALYHEGFLVQVRSNPQDDCGGMWFAKKGTQIRLAKRQRVSDCLRKIIPAYYMPHFKPWYPALCHPYHSAITGHFQRLPPSLRSFRVLMRTNLKEQLWLEQFGLSISVGLELMPFNLKQFLRKVLPRGVLQRNVQ